MVQCRSMVWATDGISAAANCAWGASGDRELPRGQSRQAAPALRNGPIFGRAAADATRNTYPRRKAVLGLVRWAIVCRIISAHEKTPPSSFRLAGWLVVVLLRVSYSSLPFPELTATSCPPA